MMIKNIPLTIITGYLGVGKTTAIRQLLKHKPQSERWAVLVNEMGEVGIDGEFYKKDDVTYREVAGGCMCCVGNLPSKVALNQLIREVKPDRIIIEPSGIASPASIVRTYTSPDYQNVITLMATICLLDPWTITQPSFFELDTFQEQLSVADVVLATKGDIANVEHIDAFEKFCQGLGENKRWDIIEHGMINPIWLDRRRHASGKIQRFSMPAQPHKVRQQTVSTIEGVSRAENQTPDAWSCGWTISPVYCFDETRLHGWLVNTDIPRIKGKVRCADSVLLINKMRDNVTIEAIDDDPHENSVLELITLDEPDWSQIEEALLGLLSTAG